MSEAPSGIVSETKNETPLVDRIWEALEKSEGRESVNEVRRLRQKEILQRLPSDFEMEMKATVIIKRAGEGLDQRNHLRGEVFENLVRADPNICPTEETPQAKTVRSILSEPFRFDLASEGIGSAMQNPDTAHVNQKGEIDWVVEAKTSDLDRRGLIQIAKFKNVLSTLINKLKKIDPQKLRSHGLSAIVDNPETLKISKYFAIKLALPAGIYNGSVESLLKVRYPSHEDLDMLNRCRIRESPFSVSDLENITDTILGWYKEKTV